MTHTLTPFNHHFRSNAKIFSRAHRLVDGAAHGRRSAVHLRDTLALFQRTVARRLGGADIAQPPACAARCCPVAFGVAVVS